MLFASLLLLQLSYARNCSMFSKCLAATSNCLRVENSGEYPPSIHSSHKYEFMPSQYLWVTWNFVISGTLAAIACRYHKYSFAVHFPCIDSLKRVLMFHLNAGEKQ
jgi:hypothetical protein